MPKKSKKKFSLSLFITLLLLATLAATLIFSASIKRMLSKDDLPRAGCASPDLLSQSGMFDPTQLQATWLGESTSPLASQIDSSQALALGQVLGSKDEQENKWIEVDLTTQKVKAHQGNKVIYSLPISSGKFAPTPTGEYEIWYKVKYTKMEGGVKGTGTYYYLPNVPFTMFFYKDFGLHGTYWHNSFGHPMSHGCVNMSIVNAQKLFNWAGPYLPENKSAIMASETNPGTKVIVHGQAPRI